MPDLSFEIDVIKQHQVTYIAGLDEAGRGALAGPVTAAAVILPLDDKTRLAKLEQVNDSKQLSAKKRDEFYDLVIEHSLAYGIGSTAAEIIDEIGIIASTKRAMRLALAQLAQPADFLLIDGRIRLATLATPQQSIIRGDSRSLSIAAASILAKVTRDRKMVELAAAYPGYDLDQHKGYGTKKHITAIEKLGPCKIHRHSFAPIRPPIL